MIVKFSLIFILYLGFVESAKILVVYPTISKSHVMPLQSLVFHLLEKEHDVTFVTTSISNKKIKNYREILVPSENEKKGLGEIFDQNKTGFFEAMQFLTRFIYGIGNKTLQMEEMNNLKKEKFDLVIVGYFLTDFMLGLGDHFKCPTILFGSGGAMITIFDAIGNPRGVNGFPYVMLTDKTMNFMGRLKTFFANGLEIVATQYFKYRSRQIYE